MYHAIVCSYAAAVAIDVLLLLLTLPRRCSSRPVSVARRCTGRSRADDAGRWTREAYAACAAAGEVRGRRRKG